MPKGQIIPTTTEPLDKVESLDSAELSTLKSLMDVIREPQAALSAFQTHLTKKYNLGQQDRIDLNLGIIYRQTKTE